MFAAKTQRTIEHPRRFVWTSGLCTLVALGVVSCVVIVHAEEWWNKDPENYVQAASRLINAAPAPVVIVSDAWFIPVLSLEHKLRADVRYQLTTEPALPAIDDQHAASIFALRPSRHLREAMQRRYAFELVDPAADLWRLTRQSSAPARTGGS